jgi:ubiquinone/menaquinone biosynthesis C-methylase UbiE
MKYNARADNMDDQLQQEINDFKAKLAHNVSLDYKKYDVLDRYITGGDAFLDLGSGTGDLLELEKDKFNTLFGLDEPGPYLDICRKRIKHYKNVHIIEADIQYLANVVDRQYDCIAASDVLEHVDLEACMKVLRDIHHLLKSNRRFIFTAPGFLEKIRIQLGISPWHKHCHSSYGWMALIKQAGFHVIAVETVEFPLVHSDLLRRKLHLFGRCCVIVSEKK